MRALLLSVLWLTIGVSTFAWALEPLPDPFHTLILEDATFDAAIFPEGKSLSAQRPHLVMFYSPSCGHCRHMLPIFNNASVQLYATPDHPEWETESARLVIVDAIKNTKLAAQYKIRSYPTFYYFVNGRAHRYLAPQTVSSFMSVAVDLSTGLRESTFAKDVTAIADFKKVAKAENVRRPWFVMCRPTSPPKSVAGGPRDVPETLAEALLTYGKAKFVQIYEADGPSMSERPEGPTGDALLDSYWTIRDNCAEARSKCKGSQGPHGESLLLWSDRTRVPLAYRGPKWEGDGETGMAPFIAVGTGVSQFRPHRQIALWVWENSYNAVEVLSPVVLPVVSKRARLGVLVVDGEIDLASDIRFVPAIQKLAQKRFDSFVEANPFASSGIVAHYLAKENIPLTDEFEKISHLARMWAHTPTQFLIADGNRYKEWLGGLGVGADDAPHFFVLDAMKETIWRLLEWAPKEKQDLLSKALRFETDGEEIKLMDAFLNDVEGVKGSAVKGSSTSAMGGVVSFIVNWVPFASWLMHAVGDDSLKFVIVLVGMAGWSMVFAVSLRRQPEDDEVTTPLLDRKFV